MTGRAGYLRTPAISGDTLYFACEDDLWSVPADGGRAHRLTAGPGEARRPRISPDGTEIAFVGTDDGPAEVYVMPAEGGRPRRLTYQAGRCVTVGWHPHTGEVLYATDAEQPSGFGARLFSVPPAGGPARPLRLGPADTIAFGDGGVVVGRNTADPARWKRYRGGGTGELWYAEQEAGPFTRLVALPGNVADPCWAGGRVHFISDHEGIGNVYSCLPDGTDLRRHTGHHDHYARGLTTDGTRLVYTAGARLHLLDALGARPVEVDLGGAAPQRGRRFAPAGEYLDGARLSPDGTRLAVTARGKAFTFEHWSGPVRGHGSADGVRYRLLRWLAGGRQLVAVAADESPDERIVLMAAEGGEDTSVLVSGGVGHITELAASPVSGLVAFATSRQRVWLVDTADVLPRPRLLDASKHERIEDLAWSPDGRWLAYTFPESPRTSSIKLADTASGRTHRVTEPVVRDARPAFDPSGRYLYFLGQRDLTPELDQVQFDVGFPFGSRPYLITLRAGEESPFEARTAVPGAALPATGGDGRVEVDLDGISRRVAAFPVPEGRYSDIAALPGRVLLLSVPLAAPDPAHPDAGAEGTVTLVDLRSGRVTAGCLGPVDELHVRGDVVLHRTDSRLRVLRADAAGDPPDGEEPGPATGWVDLGRVKVPFDPSAEWRQMFREAWQLQREGYWDAGMSGLDWDAVYDRYAPLAELVSCRAELSDLIWELHGELGTSHAFERGGEYRAGPDEAQGFLGVDWDTSADGSQWRIARILRGDAWNPKAGSPCARLGADIRAGDAVVAVNGRRVGPAGPGELLVGQADREVELTLRRAGAAEHRVVVRACAGEARARYLDWAEGNRAYVRAVSGERLGYLHVPDMTRAGYADFVRGFLTELDRDGLIVDVRFNTGGHVSPLLLDRLARRRTGTEHGRWSGPAPYPTESPRGPMATLLNEHTGSDGEIFAHVFRALGLGPLIGRRSWGGVIATWPRHRLVDGTVTTQPEFRYRFGDAGGSLENHGVEPDLAVVPAPDRLLPGEDDQLAAAVAHLLAELGSPSDELPAPRAALLLPQVP
ncbi:S41 family peptidase [Amycolatopsis sp. cmx-4-68]|uniref:S41 family peptidase n=1 Tax=Amycolatopsis sp. cmx-4-68 TaxID=2790938 RepID=UPI00397A632F